MPRFVAAIDGGGTKTAVAVSGGDDGVRRLPDGPPCCPQDGPAWRDGLAHALDRLDSGTDVVVGMPGYGEVTAHDVAVRGFLDSYSRLRILAVLNDVELAHYGAFDGGHGLLVLAGTGSMALAKGPQGLVRVGGWGSRIGDDGSAYQIGREALSRAARQIDAVETMTEFTSTLLDALGVPRRPTGLFDWMYESDTPRARIASVAATVADLAGAWPDAERLLVEAAASLAAQGRSAAAQAGLTMPYHWTASGSLLGNPTVLAGVEQELGPVSRPRMTVLDGALALATRIGAGIDPSEEGDAPGNLVQPERNIT